MKKNKNPWLVSDTFALTGALSTGKSLFWILLIGLPLALTAAADEWTPAVRVGVTHTDNVNLSNVESIDQTVWRIEPSVGYERVDDHLDVNLNYNLQVLRYQELSRTETFDQYAANMRLKVFDEKIYMNIGADKRQVQATPDATIPTGNLPLSENRRDRVQYFVEPGVQLNFGDSVVLRSSVRNGWVDFSDGGDGLAGQQVAAGSGVGAEQRSANFEIDNISGGTGLTWALRYDWQRSDFDERGVFENQTANVELGYWVGNKLRAFGGFGKESPWDQPLSPSLEDDRWEAGVEYGAGADMRFLLAAGERSFGRSGRLEFERTLKRGSVSLNYSETPISENQEVFQNGVFAGPLANENLLARPDQPERFISKRLELVANFVTPVTTAGFSIFRGERSDRTTILGTPLSDDSQAGFRFNLERGFGAKTSLSLFLSAVDRELLVGGSSEILSSRIRLGYRLGAKTNFSVEYEYTDEDADSSNLAIRDYTANSISIFIQRNFLVKRR